MIDPGLIMLGLFLLLLLTGAPIAIALGASGALIMVTENLGAPAIATNAYTSISKYPLLALPLFILAGMVFERAGVAERMVRFLSVLVGQWRGAKALVAISVCLLLGGISGSGVADAAAVAAVMLPAMTRAGYPKAFSASLIAAGGTTAILIPPSVGFILYSILVPQASVPAMFAAGIVPGFMAGLALIVPAIWLARRHQWEALPDLAAAAAPKRSSAELWRLFREAIWGLIAPLIVLGGLRTGLFTPTEAAVVAASYGMFVGLVIYRSMTLRGLWLCFVDAAEVSAVVMIIMALASNFAYAGSVLGALDHLANFLIQVFNSPGAVLAAVMVMLLLAGMVLDAPSILLIFVPLLIPVALHFEWDLVWFGVLMTMNLAIGQITPPMAVNLLVTARIAGVTVEQTTRWALWFVGALMVALLMVAIFPATALWVPTKMGFQ